MKPNECRECRPRHSVRKFLSLILSICILFTIIAGLDFSAYALSTSGSCGNKVTYTFTSTGKLVISGTGAMTNYSSSSSPFYNQSEIKSVVINSGVTSIGSYAFYRCKGLTTVIIPDSVTSIGDSAFYGCTGLTSVTIPNSVTSIGNGAFYNCTGLTSVTIPDSVTSIVSYAFFGCTGLTSVTIPNSVTSIGEYAFYGVKNIMYNGSASGSPWGAKNVNKYAEGYLVYSDSSKTEIIACSTAADEIVIPNSVTSIGRYAFSNCTGLTSVTIPDSITSIGDYAFYGCTGLTSVTIPNSVTSIGYSAFEYCTGLTSIAIPNSVTSIGSGAFEDCTGLTSVIIPDSVTSIVSYAFSGCTGLTSVTIPDSVTSIGNSAFSGCESLTSITIPNSVTSIGDMAFGYCTSLTSINVDSANKNYTSVDGVLFNKAITKLIQYPIGNSLTSVTIPNSVTSIGFSAFRKCTSLTSVTIPDSVISIGRYAFDDCTGLQNIIYLGTQSQWSSISKGSDAIPSFATIIYHTSCTYDLVETIEPTCFETGYNLYRCKCNKEYKEILPIKHTVGEVFEQQEPDCLNDGYIIYECAICSEIIFEEPKALGHTNSEVVIENRVEPTCTEDGSYDEVVYCSVCGLELSRNNVVASSKEILVDSSKYPESPHNYSNNMNTTYSFSYSGADSLKITFSSSTETESGYDYIYLYDSNGSQIGKYDGTSLAGKSFTIAGDSFSLKLTSDGLQTRYGFSFSSIYAIIKGDGSLKAGHKYELVEYIEPDCENEGITKLKCSSCGDEITEKVDALGHNLETDLGVDATCTEDGLTDGSHCSRCSKILVEQSIIPATGHSYELYRTTATCEKSGYDVYKCSVCSVTKSEKVDAHHTCDTFVGVVDGELSYSCSVCGKEYTQSASDVLKMWDSSIINASAEEHPELDVVNDGIINAKDYAMLNHIKNSGY